MAVNRSKLWQHYCGLPVDEQSRLVEMAWEDRTPFDAIEHQFGLAESDIIRLMQRLLKPASFRGWRARVTGRATKHTHRRSNDVIRHHCPTQYKPRNR